MNHKLKVMEGIYHIREEIPERREAMDIWAQFVADLCDGLEPQTERPSNVIQMRKARVASLSQAWNVTGFAVS